LFPSVHLRDPFIFTMTLVCGRSAATVAAVLLSFVIANGSKIDVMAAEAFVASAARHLVEPASVPAERHLVEPAILSDAPLPKMVPPEVGLERLSSNVPSAAPITSSRSAATAQIPLTIQQASAVAAVAEKAAIDAAAAADVASKAAVQAAAAAAAASTAATAASATESQTAPPNSTAIAKTVTASIAPQTNTTSGLGWLWYALTVYMPQVARLLQGLTFALVIKSMCLAGNVLVQVSPFSQVKRWESRGDTGEVDPAPYVSIAFGGWQWCFYGSFAFLVTQRSGFLILVHSNCLGAVLGTYYAITFYRNCRNLEMLDSFHRYLSAVASLVVLQACQLCVLPPERALFVTGLISSFCSFVGAMSMLVVVPQVIRTRDSKAIAGPLVVANMLSAIVWCICGWMLEDLLVAGPNVIATLSSGMCVYLKYKYPSSSSDDEPCACKDKEEVAARLAMDGLVPPKRVQSIVKGKGLKLPPTIFTPSELSVHLSSTKEADGTGGTC